MNSLSHAVALTTLQSLASGLSKDKHDKHAFIVSHVTLIIALALCKAPPKGLGNPADHAKLADTFAAAKLTSYAQHCAAFPQAFKETRMRSVDAWDKAQELAADIVVTAFAGCAPRSYSAEELAAKAEKKLAAKAAKLAADKLAEREAKDEAKEERQRIHSDGFAEGRDSVVVTGTMIAELILSGHFGAADLAMIAQALPDVIELTEVTLTGADVAADVATA